jgi:hypothetical protein
MGETQNWMMAMTVAVMTAGSRMLWALGALGGAILFAFFAIGQPLSFLSSGQPVSQSLAFAAWVGPLAGLPMAALAYFALALIALRPSGQARWDALSARSLVFGLWGMGMGALWSGAALLGALMLYGPAPAHVGGAGMALAAIAILLGHSAVTMVNLYRMARNGVWTALGHILWGLIGIVAMTAGLPMVLDAVMIDDGRALVQRYNLLVIFYPLLWLAYLACTAALVVFGAKSLRFSLSAHEENSVAPSNEGAAPQVAPVATLEIAKLAA